MRIFLIVINFVCLTIIHLHTFIQLRAHFHILICPYVTLHFDLTMIGTFMMISVEAIIIQSYSRVVLRLLMIMFPDGNYTRLIGANLVAFALQELSMDMIQDSTDPLSYFSNTILEIAHICIPKTSNNHACKTFITEECNNAIKARKAALRRFKCNPTKDNLESYRKLRAKARRTIKSSKRKSWKEYVSKLNSSTSAKKVWNIWVEELVENLQIANKFI